MERYRSNNYSTLLQVDASQTEDRILQILDSLVSSFPPQDDWDVTTAEGHGSRSLRGLYSGPTGFAYALMNVAKAYPSMKIQHKTAWEWAGQYLSGKRPEADFDPRYLGIMTETHCFNAVAAAYYKDMSYVNALLATVDQILTTKNGFSEHCLGRVGILYILRLVKAWYPESTSSITPAIQQIIEQILDLGPPWLLVRPGIDLVGASHGRAGIITQILLSDPSYASHPAIKTVLAELLNLQDSTGNWTRSTVIPDSELAHTNPPPDISDLVQWCHGAPGIVQCLMAIRESFPDLYEAIDQAIERGRQLTWEKGLLRKEPNLCHGISGNAFTFPPGPQRDHFFALTTEEQIKDSLEKGEYEKCDNGMSWSLAYGKLGRAVAWMWREREKGCFISFDDV